MIPWLTHWQCAPWRVLGALATALLVALCSGPAVIASLRRRRLGERTEKTPIEDEGLRREIAAKSGTPTMGGLIIAAALLCACLLWGRLDSPCLWLPLTCFAALAAMGIADDWMKLTGEGHRDRGLKVRHKLLLQGALGCLLAWVWLRTGSASGDAASALPWPALPVHGVAVLLVLWTGLVVATMSNAVNVTDGLDGLAGGLTVTALVPLGASAWLLSPQGGGAAELPVFCAALGGAVLGFLWYNRHPARVFMGDTGSLAIGGSVGLVAVMARSEILLPLLACLFLAEFGSSVLQVLWFKATGRRILPIAPLHHMFQRNGWPEKRIVASFHAVGAAAAVICLLLLR